ncbi:MAG: esterase [Rhizobiaceae bacterium MnEN-MB40S]|nr:MAG: esterase [Rhizobiaceae bacterium MnEN-MB40S]
MIDPDIKAMLDRLQAAAGDMDAPATLQQMPDLYCREYREMSRAPDAAVEERRVGLPGTQASLCFYRPPALNEPAPTIVYLHGGGFMLGDAATYSRQSSRLAIECGAVVAFLDYRLAPEHPFPAQIEDTIAAISLLQNDATRYGVDLSRLCVMGDSAGGNLAIHAVRSHHEQNLFKCACLLYPVADFRPYAGLAPKSASDLAFASGYYLEFAEMETFAHAYLGGDMSLAEDSRVSPLAGSFPAGLPPVMMFLAENDILRDQGRALAHRLREAGNEVSCRCFDGLIHNFMQHSGISRCSDAAFLEVCRMVRAALEG